MQAVNGEYSLAGLVRSLGVLCRRHLEMEVLVRSTVVYSPRQHCLTAGQSRLLLTKEQAWRTSKGMR